MHYFIRSSIMLTIVIGTGWLLTQQMPTVHRSAVQIQKNIQKGQSAAQRVAVMVKSLINSMQQTRKKGQILRANESLQEKMVASLLMIVPLLAKSAYFLRGLRRYGISETTIDKLIQHFELNKLTRTVMTRGWLGWNGGISAIGLNLSLRGILLGVQEIKESLYSITK